MACGIQHELLRSDITFPRFQKDPTWSETGDRYLLKLFRDHLFHQVTEAGAPWIDLSHIISCLNKVICIWVLKDHNVYQQFVELHLLQTPRDLRNEDVL